MKGWYTELMAEHCTNIDFGHEFAQIGKFSPPIEYYQTENIFDFWDWAKVGLYQGPILS